MGERVRRDTTLRLALDAVVADGGGRVQRARDLGLRRCLQQARVGRVSGPYARVAVGLELDPYRLAGGRGNGRGDA